MSRLFASYRRHRRESHYFFVEADLIGPLGVLTASDLVGVDAWLRLAFLMVPEDALW